MTTTRRLQGSGPVRLLAGPLTGGGHRVFSPVFPALTCDFIRITTHPRLTLIGTTWSDDAGVDSMLPLQ